MTEEDQDDIEPEIDELLAKFQLACEDHTYAAIVNAAIETILISVDDVMSDPELKGEAFVGYVAMLLRGAMQVMEEEAEQDAPRIQLLN